MTYIEILFRKFNVDYFGNLVPMIPVYFSSCPIPEWGYCDAHNEYIMLSPILKDYQLCLEGVLIHEMIHAYLNITFHTKEFRKLEKKINKWHFGDSKAHEKHYQKMISDLLTKTWGRDILNQSSFYNI